MTDDKEIGKASTGDPVEEAGVDEEKEKVFAAKASREMWTAILVIVGSFVFVLVAAALIIVIGHIQLF